MGSEPSAEISREVIRVLAAGVADRRRRRRVVAAACCVPGALLAAFATATGGRGWSDAVELGFLSMVPSAIALLTTLGHPEQARVIGRVLDDRERIVWLYMVEPSWRGRFVFVGLEDGRSFRAAAPLAPRTDDGVEGVLAAERAQMELIDALSAFAPRATVGFTLERLATFAEDARSMRRS